MNILAFIFLLFNLTQLHEAGFRGEGMKIAVIDGGFYRANDPTIFPQDHILGVYDLLQGDSLAADTFDIFSNPDNSHGTMVLSTMLYRDSASGFVGTAPEAHYYLIRSEDVFMEYYEEVERLVRAFALADSLDADIVTVSLGYHTFDSIPSLRHPSFTYQDMNGTSVAAQAAQRLARNNRLVLVAAGNDGNKDWHYLSTPADADSILTVGAVGADSLAANFTSYGPTADGRIKPEVSAIGKSTTIYRPSEKDSLGNIYGTLGTGNGTSFSTPQTAGMAACLWQALPNLTAMELRDLIIRSSSLYPLHDDQRGYGIPDAWFAYSGQRTVLPGNGAEGNGSADGASPFKTIRNNRVVIVRDGIEYTVLGVRIE